jgi:hypothetical protein
LEINPVGLVDARTLAREFPGLSFRPYRPVRGQLLAILRSVNRTRHLSGHPRLPVSVIRFKRWIVSCQARLSRCGIRLKFSESS